MFKFLRISSKKFLELNVAEMSNWQTAGNFKSVKTKYLHTGLSEDLEAYSKKKFIKFCAFFISSPSEEARKETRFDQALVRGRGRGRSTWRGNRGNRGGKRGVTHKDGHRNFTGAEVRGLATAMNSGQAGGRRTCHRCGSESHLQNKCTQPLRQ